MREYTFTFTNPPMTVQVAGEAGPLRISITGAVEVFANGLELGELAAQPPVEWGDNHLAIVEVPSSSATARRTNRGRLARARSGTRTARRGPRPRDRPQRPSTEFEEDRDGRNRRRDDQRPRRATNVSLLRREFDIAIEHADEHRHVFSSHTSDANTEQCATSNRNVYSPRLHRDVWPLQSISIVTSRGSPLAAMTNGAHPSAFVPG